MRGARGAQANKIFRGARALTPEEIAARAAHVADERRADDVEILDLRSLTVMTDYFVIASGTTAVQVRAITEHIWDDLEHLGVRFKRREGYTDGRWVLLDYGDVVVHIFRHEDRQLYDLERLWGDAPRCAAQWDSDRLDLVVRDE